MGSCCWKCTLGSNVFRKKFLEKIRFLSFQRVNLVVKKYRVFFSVTYVN